MIIGDVANMLEHKVHTQSRELTKYLLKFASIRSWMDIEGCFSKFDPLDIQNTTDFYPT